jgi:hypothetical protein
VVGRLASLLSLTLCACQGSVDDAPAVTDAGVDGRLVHAPADAPAPIAKCGPGPYVFHGLVIVDEAKKPLMDLKMSIDLCPELVVEPNADGIAEIATTMGRPYDVLVEHPSISPIAFGRYAAQLPVAEARRFYGHVDGYDPKVPMLGIAGSAEPTGPCSTLIGLRVHVLDHEEAKVHYYRDGVDNDAPDPERESDIFITGLAPDLVVSVIGEKDGCVVSTNAVSTQTGQIETRTKYISVVDLFVMDPKP